MDRRGRTLLCLCLLASCAGAQVISPTADQLKAIEHVVIIVNEDWGFDSLFGLFNRGANGYARNGAILQMDKQGQFLTSLPPPLLNGKPDDRFPASMATRFYDINQYAPMSSVTGDLAHTFYRQQRQINRGQMDLFVAESDNGGLATGFFDFANSGLSVGNLAKQFTLCDNMFHSAFGGGFLNHQYLIAAAAPTFPNAPAYMVYNASQPTVERQVTTDGFVVNDAYSRASPHPAGIPSTDLVPPQTAPTIGDRLSAAQLSWNWYSGGWTDALRGMPDSSFHYQHQPFNYFANYAEGQTGRSHLKDEQEFLDAALSGNLPAVSFVKPLSQYTGDPGFGTILDMNVHTASLIDAVMSGPQWNTTAIFVIWDDNGGRWDHVPPPTGDAFGPGVRVPMIIISPFARKGYVDHTQYETVSLLKFIETRWGLTPLNQRDGASTPPLHPFVFPTAAPPTPPPQTPAPEVPVGPAKDTAAGISIFIIIVIVMAAAAIVFIMAQHSVFTKRRWIDHPADEDDDDEPKKDVKLDSKKRADEEEEEEEEEEDDGKLTGRGPAPLPASLGRPSATPAPSPAPAPAPVPATPKKDLLPDPPAYISPLTNKPINAHVPAPAPAAPAPAPAAPAPAPAPASAASTYGFGSAPAPAPAPSPAPAASASTGSVGRSQGKTWN